MLDLSDSYQFKRPKPADNQHRRAAQLAQCQYANEKLDRQQAGCPCRSAMDCPFADVVEEIPSHCLELTRLFSRKTRREHVQ